MPRRRLASLRTTVISKAVSLKLVTDILRWDLGREPQQGLQSIVGETREIVEHLVTVPFSGSVALTRSVPLQAKDRASCVQAPQRTIMLGSLGADTIEK